MAAAPEDDASESASSEDAEWHDPRPVIVGIGASAGGVQALQVFFEAFPADTGAAVVAIMHLDPAGHSDLSRILATRTVMPVSQVGGPEPLQPNHVYVIPPDRRLVIRDDEIASAEFE
jgi:two-component system CheB/CheR fusion protein